MLRLQPTLTGLPAYVVFPESARPDSADIDFAGRFSTSKIKMRFNDNWFRKLVCKKGRTCAFGLDRFGSIVFETPVDKLDTNTLNSYLTLNQPSDDVPDGSLLAYQDSLQFKFDDQLARLVVSNRYKEKILYSIKSSSFDLSLIANRLSGIKKEKFLKYGTQINREMTGFLCRFQSFRILDDSTILMCLLYHNTPDSISPKITDEYAFIEYSLNGKLRNIRLVDIPEDIVIYDPSFIFDLNSIYVAFWRLNNRHEAEPDNWDSVRFIARLNVKDGQYIMDSILPQKIPWYYAMRKTYNYLALTYSAYPYVTSYLGNEITNLLTGKTVEIVPNAAFRKDIDFSVGGGSFDQGLEKFHCYGIGLDKKTGEVIAIYQFSNSFKLSRYNKDLSQISYSAISYDFLPGENLIWGSVYPEINLLEMRTKMKDGVYRQYYLPLDFFYS